MPPARTESPNPETGVTLDMQSPRRWPPPVRRPTRFAPFAAATLAAAAGLFVPLAAIAQEDKLAPPEGWLVRTDHGGDWAEALDFMQMPPGWHITTGPAGIFYHPETTASGDFRVESTVFLFDPEGRNEAFGVFIGGTDLEGDGQAYTYFLIRGDGSALLKRRDGARTSILQGWTKHEAVVSWAARGEEAATAKNVLFVEAAGDEIIFGVNDVEVFRTGRGGQHVDGVVGLRVNHGLNLHVSSLEVTAREASDG